MPIRSPISRACCDEKLRCSMAQVWPIAADGATSTVRRDAPTSHALRACGPMRARMAGASRDLVLFTYQLRLKCPHLYSRAREPRLGDTNFGLKSDIRVMRVAIRFPAVPGTHQAPAAVQTSRVSHRVKARVAGGQDRREVARSSLSCRIRRSPDRSSRPAGLCRSSCPADPVADRLLAGVGHSGVHRGRHSEQSRGRGYGIDLDPIAAALWGYTRRRSATSAARHLRQPLAADAHRRRASLLVGGIGELVRRKVLDRGTEDEGGGRGARSTDAAPAEERQAPRSATQPAPAVIGAAEVDAATGTPRRPTG